MLNKFHELDVDRSGKLDQDEAKQGLELMTTATGRKLDPREIEFFLKTASDDEGFIDIGKFVSLFKRLKVYDCPPPPKNAKCHVLGSDWNVTDQVDFETVVGRWNYDDVLHKGFWGFIFSSCYSGLIPIVCIHISALKGYILLNRITLQSLWLLYGICLLFCWIFALFYHDKKEIKSYKE